MVKVEDPIIREAGQEVKEEPGSQVVYYNLSSDHHNYTLPVEARVEGYDYESKCCNSLQISMMKKQSMMVSKTTMPPSGCTPKLRL